MGVKDFWAWLRKAEANCFYDVNLDDFCHGRRIGVDLSQWMHQYLAIFATSILFKESFDSAIAYILKAANALTQTGANLVFVADRRDGLQWRAKLHTDQHRKFRRMQALAKYQTESDDAVRKQHLKAAFYIPPQLQAAMIARLRLEGYTVIQSPCEADAQLAVLHREKTIDAVMSTDTDLAIHGVSRIIMNWNLASNKATVFVWQKISRASIDDILLQTLKDAPAAARTRYLQLLASLSGCDYFKAMQIGPATARKCVLSVIQSCGCEAPGLVLIYAKAAVVVFETLNTDVYIHGAIQQDTGHHALVRVDRLSLATALRTSCEAYRLQPAVSLATSPPSIVTSSGALPDAQAQQRLGYSIAVLKQELVAALAAAAVDY